jgi:O-antigen ligase
MSHLVLLLVAAPVLLGGLVVLLRQPMRWALPVYAVWMPFGGLLAVGTSRFGSLSSVLGVILGVGLVLQLMGERRHGVRISATVPLWLLFLAVAAGTVLWSISPSETSAGFLILSSLVLIYVFVACNQVDREILTRTENGLIVGGALCTLYGFAQFLFLGGFPNDPTAGPGSGSTGRFGNDMLGPNNQAIALLLPLLFTLSRSVTMQERSKRVLNAALSALLLIGILMTGSRGGVLATFVSLIVLALSNPVGRRTLFKYAAGAIVVIALVWVYHPGGIADRTVSTTSSSGRTDIWRVGLAACPRYCPVGAGWETFPDVYAATQASVPGAAVLVGQGGSYQPHNVWLLVAIELGLPGLVIFAAVLMVTFYEGLRLPVSLRGPPLSGFIATIFGALFLSNLEYKFFWMALIMVALSRNLALVEAKAAREQTALTPVGSVV